MRHNARMSSSREQAARADPFHSGVTAVISHLVLAGHEADYEAWLEKIGPVSRQWPGHLDWHLIRPVAGVTRTYVVVLRFRTRAHLESWIASEVRAKLLDEVRPILEAEDQFHVSSGLDFWFVPEGAHAQVPVRWKQALITWSAIFPLVTLTPLAVTPILRALGLPATRTGDTLVTTGLVVALMVYAVMPRYTKAVRNWLFHAPERISS
jgi:uncharacterized protein